MQLTLDRSTLEGLLCHAALAALVGHLDDDHAGIVGQIGNQFDAVVDGLTGFLGEPRARAAPDAAAPDDRTAPMLASGAGGAR